MSKLTRLDAQRYAQLAAQVPGIFPLEQSVTWDAYDQAMGRKGGLKLAWEVGGQTRALISLTEFSLRGLPYLWAKEGPVWVGPRPSAAEEEQFLRLLTQALRSLQPKAVFVRLHTFSAPAPLAPVLQSIAYDRTVVLDLSGGAEQILARMKSRGRRDVRKAMRETGMQCADETDKAEQVFGELYQIMVETAAHDGFSPHPESVYRTMLKSLGENARLLVGRIEGKAVAWSLVTISGRHATRYYAATNAQARRLRAADQLVYFEACALAERGCTTYDLMGIGSDFAPSLAGLTEFKTKFTKDIEEIAPARDLPLRGALYRGLVRALALKRKVGGLRAELRGKVKAGAAGGEAGAAGGGFGANWDEGWDCQWAGQMAQSPAGKDFRVLILGGDIGGVSLARSTWLAYRARPLLIAKGPSPFAAHLHKAEVKYVADLEDPAHLRQVIGRVAGAQNTPLLVLTAFEYFAQTLAQIAGDLPENAILPFVGRELMEEVSDKANFARYCQRLEIGHPQTIVHRISGEADLPDVSSLGWPVIGKAARSAEHHVLDFAGKEKVYELAGPAELAELIGRLSRAGFRGEFVFQRRVGGDDAQMRILTCYVDKQGQVKQAGFGQVIVEEHTKELLGNPAGILTYPQPEVTAQASRLLESVGWRGWANFDIKADPADGTARFFELNPRLGRSNFYLNVAGINPVETIVTDLIDGQEVKENWGTQRGLYTVVPLGLLLAYALGWGERRAIVTAVRRGKAVNPLWSRYELDPRRWLVQIIQGLKQIKRFHHYYPLRTVRALRAAARLAGGEGQ